MPLPLLLRVLPSAAFNILTWKELFNDFVPQVVHTIRVEAQGGPLTPANQVVHMALASAFGCIPFQPAIPAKNLTLKATIGHTTNTAVVEFSYAVDTAGEVAHHVLKRVQAAAENSINRLKGGVRKIAEGDIGGGVKEIENGVFPWILAPSIIRGIGGGSGRIGKRIVSGVAGNRDKSVQAAQRNRPPNWAANPGVKNVKGGAPPVIADNKVQQDKAAQQDPAKKEALKEAGDREGLLQRLWGTMTVYELGRDAIKGGQPPLLFDTLDPADRPVPFGRMVGNVLLTRERTGNPQPPTDDPTRAELPGVGLRTLVAQVLHDPGTRPPLPLTDAGPPAVLNEAKGE